MNNPKTLIVHHTGGTDADPLADTSRQTFEIVNEYHRKLWNFRSSLGFYIGYHYFIDRHGRVRQGRANTDHGAHTIGQNQSSIGICLAGNFDATEPTLEQTNALRQLLLKLMKEYNISVNNIVPHRHYANKTCYGKKLGDDWARRLVTEDPTYKKELEDKIMELKALVIQLIAEYEEKFGVQYPGAR
jgi:hypothetical protein